MNINLMNGDCLELMKTIPSGSVDMVLCDPPYGTTSCKWDSVIPFEPMWKELNRIVKPNGAILLFAQTPFDKVLGCSNLKNLRYEWIWIKDSGTGFLNSKKMPLKKHENILVFYNKLPTYNPQFTNGKPYIAKSNIKDDVTVYGNIGAKERIFTVSDGRRYPTTTDLNFHRQKDRGLHPTQKPVALLEYLIKTYTNEGDIVLDFTMGSGSTGVAAKNLRRGFIGIEMDEKYFNIAKNRIESV